MPAKNVYHDAAVGVLTADGWTVTADLRPGCGRSGGSVQFKQ
jgi:hypothetical protein